MPVLLQRTSGAWDETAIWVLFIYEESEVYYLYNTGVTHAIAQSIMLATSTNPADPASWQSQGVIFQPNHPDMIWGGNGVFASRPLVRLWSSFDAVEWYA